MKKRTVCVLVRFDSTRLRMPVCAYPNRALALRALKSHGWCHAAHMRDRRNWFERRDASGYVHPEMVALTTVRLVGRSEAFPLTPRSILRVLERNGTRGL